VLAFETTQAILGRSLRVVVTHSVEFHRQQSRGFDQTLAKAVAPLSDLAWHLAGGPEPLKPKGRRNGDRADRGAALGEAGIARRAEWLDLEGPGS
jgi:hypothetical protein